MISVKIELMSAISGATTEIGRMYLCNDETRSLASQGKLGDYLVAVCRRGTDDVPRPVDPDGPTPTRSGRVENYPRLAFNVWRLVARALHAAFPEEKHPGTKPLVSPQVMNGLQLLRRHLVDNGHNWTTAEMADVNTANVWLAAATGSDV